MKKFKFIFLAAFLLFAIAFTFSCSSTDVPELPQQEIPYSSGEQQDWCVYASLGLCFQATSAGCTGEGILAPVCPYNSSSSVYSSSDSGGESSSSFSNSSSSVVSSSSESDEESSSSNEDGGNSSSDVEEDSSSSVVSSSSGELPSSSSSVVSSSSSELPSSSSSVVSSSSSELPSSSSSVVSSSSESNGESSSSSEDGSSSSIAQSSSSICTAADNDETQYCSNGTMKDYGFVEDADGNTYKTVVIGDQTWMAENLNYATSSGSACYSNSNTNCATYGRLYNWATAITVCPSDWHLPSNDEWQTLINYVGESMAGRYLKANSEWSNCAYCEDTYGFAALPGGGSAGSSFSLYFHGYWWSASESENDASKAYLFRMSYTVNGVDSYENSNSELFSVRCLKDD